MKAYISVCPIGCFGFDEKGKLLAYKLFPKDPARIAECLKSYRKGSKTPEESYVLDKLSGYDVYRGGIADAKVRNFRELALGFGWVKSEQELNKIITEVNVNLTGNEIKKVKRDKLLMSAIGVLDELDRVLNSFSERLREWYGLSFPGLGKLVDSHERFAKIVSSGPERGDKKIIRAMENSGIPLSGEDMDIVKGFSGSILELCKLKKSLTKYLEGLSREISPNISGVAGALLSSRLIALAGGLEKISRMPSSTIQLLGAEKALFRHLRGKGKAPKYGVIFGHPLVQNAKPENKAKVARLLSSKISIASKLDHFSGEDRGEKLRKELGEEVRRLR